MTKNINLVLTIVLNTVGVNETNIRKKHLPVLILMFRDVLHTVTHTQFRDSEINHIPTEVSCVHTHRSS